jgi:hypothetical protein
MKAHVRFGSKADIAVGVPNVCLVPIADIGARWLFLVIADTGAAWMSRRRGIELHVITAQGRAAADTSWAMALLCATSGNF